MRLFMPAAFDSPPERELHRRLTPHSESVTSALKGVDKHASHGLSKDGSGAVEAARQGLSRISYAAGEASRTVHTLDTQARTALLRLAFPVTSHGHSTTNSSRSGDAAEDWAEAICRVVRSQSEGCSNPPQHVL